MNVVPMTPLTSVKILKNVPLDRTYTDTLKFSSVSQQISYFTGKAKDTFTGLTPIRMQNRIKLPKSADYLYDCNYIMYQNANFNNKWFYAFIKSVDFINVNMCEIEVELDAYQTWQFDITVKPSFVVREHSLTDGVGDNLVSENLDIGYYREQPWKATSLFSNYKVVIATSWDGDNDTGGYIGGLFTGLTYLGFDIDTPQQVQTVKDTIKLFTDANKSDSIVSIFMMPSIFHTNEGQPVTREFVETKRVTTVGSYTPRNKKLLTYPYNFLYAFTPDGVNAVYRYEFFDSANCSFELTSAMSCNPEIIMSPKNYQKQSVARNESLTLSGFPQCAYAIDSFRAWLAQSATSTGLSLLGSLSTAMASPVSSGLGFANTVNSVVEASQRPPIIRGSQGNSTLVGNRTKNFYFVNKHVSEEYAKIIDDYFSMYGYATNRVKVPNMSGRPSWNYVQTNEVKIVGSVPFGDMEKIKKMFNAGVTFWHGDWVGDYSRSNEVI